MASLLAGVQLGVLWPAIEAAADQAKLGLFVARLAPAPPLLVYVSATSASMLGRTVEDMLAGPPLGMLDAASAARLQPVLADPARGSRSHEATAVMADGTTKPVEIGTARFTSEGAHFVIGYVRDVSGEHNAVEALRRSEERFRFLVEHAPDGVVILVRGKIAFINPTAMRLLGADPATVIGTSIAQYLPPADAQATMQRIGEMLRTGTDIPPSEYGVLADPKRVVEIKSMVCEWDGGPGVIAFARDVTERKAMHEKFVAADRFAALGKLAAGIAHEINNPLAYAQLGVELVERRLAKLAAAVGEAELAELKTHLHEVAHGLGRIGAVTSDLRTFARADDTPPGAVDLVAVVDQSLRMVDNELRHRARLERVVVEVPAVSGIASRLEQVFVNLMINAIQALQEPATDVVMVTIEPHKDNAVVVVIRDTGHGIPAAVIDRVFDPFFTTKAVGDGMGLGLSVCKNIVEEHGGTIVVTSTTAPADQTGTTVTVTLPTFTRRSAPRISSTTPPPVPAIAQRPRTGGRITRGPRRRILLVDDEVFVRDTLVVLIGTYHDVVAVDGGAAALEHLAREHVDIILCDVMMPAMNGAEVFRLIAKAHPGLEGRVIFVTGGAFGADLVTALENTGARCLPKPFKLDQLLAAIAEMPESPT